MRGNLAAVPLTHTHTLLTHKRTLGTYTVGLETGRHPTDTSPLTKHAWSTRGGRGAWPLPAATHTAASPSRIQSASYERNSAHGTKMLPRKHFHYERNSRHGVKMLPRIRRIKSGSEKNISVAQTRNISKRRVFCKRRWSEMNKALVGWLVYGRNTVTDQSSSGRGYPRDLSSQIEKPARVPSRSVSGPGPRAPGPPAPRGPWGPRTTA